MIQIELLKMKAKMYEIKKNTMGWNSDVKEKKISEIWNIGPRQKYISSSKVVGRK